MVGVTGAIIGAAVIGGVVQAKAGKKAAKAQTAAAATAASAQDRASDVQKYIFDTTRSDYEPNRLIGQGALGKLADMYGVPRPTGATSGASPYSGGASGTTRGIYGEYVTGQELAPGSRFPFARVNAPGAAGGAAGGGPQMTAGFDGFQTTPGYQFRVSEAMRAIERSAAARGGLRSGATMDALQRRVQGVASDEYENYANRLSALAGVGQTAQAATSAAGANYASGQANIAANQGQIALAAGNARASGYANTGSAINNSIQGLGEAYLYNKGYGGYGGSSNYPPIRYPGFGNA